MHKRGLLVAGASVAAHSFNDLETGGASETENAVRMPAGPVDRHPGGQQSDAPHDQIGWPQAQVKWLKERT